ncbi:MerR family transcriptional regulator [Fodinibius halophilus]|uniref:MerR family transcriptional regulator n=1 Tax=Fodinibius halophilus TaxID=1736908 RepID=A0A6M1T8Z7_9BACT|nr:MerR family transcriptional regulator [Fodinibius halophilus]NGP89915.1 MerR family transcriptional regulator [Fodinibius halophilus]
MENKPSKEDLAFDFDFLDKLIVGIGEVSDITGVPTRKIRYWEDKGIIHSSSESGKNRRFDYKNIKKILLLKELVDEGYTLEAASEKVSKRMEMINKALASLKKKADE